MLLATPCSAPFLGTAVAFALSRGATEIFAIFAALGLGLALPYLAVAAAPGMATRLPKPGPWMAKLRLVLGFALAATGIWLLTILASLIGGSGAAAIGALMVAAGAALYFRRRTRHWFERAGGVSIAVVAVLAVMAFLVPASFPESPRPGKVDVGDSNGQWTPFDGAAIAALVADGKVVFVDVTADWCITCLINKALVLTQGRVKERLAGGNVVSMQADWTQPDDAISAYLARFQRYGIPFNAVYGPALPDGFALPELLTEQVVLDALARAAGNTAVSSRRPLL
jgi:suppressor for copper-sensitivity B